MRGVFDGRSHLNSNFWVQFPVATTVRLLELHTNTCTQFQTIRNASVNKQQGKHPKWF